MVEGAFCCCRRDGDVWSARIRELIDDDAGCDRLFELLRLRADASLDEGALELSMLK